ncbi:MAG: hypothetical protein ACRDSF_00145 [Pseudonocardiaceae bacterium]
MVLAEYIAEDRRLAVQLLIDWDSDGFQSPYSDVSELYQFINVERDLTGDIPDEVNLIEGYSVAKMTLRLSGIRDEDDLSIGDLMNPWNKESPFYGRNLFGLGVIYRILVPLSGEEREIDQFIGIIREIDTSMEDQVDITVLDLMDYINRSVTLRPIAIDFAPLIFDQIPAVRQQFNMSWVIDQILRQCGLYQSPAAVPTSGTTEGYLCATMSGAWFTEAAHYANFVTVLDTVTPPDPPFIPGKYGYAANGTQNGRGKYTYTVDPHPSWVKGESHCTGGWVYGPRECLNNESILSDIALSGTHGVAGNCRMQLILASTGVVRVRIQQFTGQAYDITFTGPTIAVEDWHYVACAMLWRVSDSAITVTFNVDGVLTVVSSSVTAFLGPTYIQAYSSINIESNMPVQHIQWWKEKSAPVVWPIDPPSTSFGVTPQTDLSLAKTWLSYVPDTYLEKGLDVLKLALAAELGVMFSTESGLIKFMSRDGVNASRIEENTFTLTPEEAKSVQIHTRVDSYRNLINTESVQKVLLDQTFFKSDDAERFDTPASTVARFYIPMRDVYRITTTAPPFINPWNPEIGVGFHVIKISDGTIPPGVSVVVTVINQRLLAVDVVNPNAFEVRLSDSSGSPALNIAGYSHYEWGNTSTTYVHQGSMDEFGSQQLDMKSSPWRSRASSQEAVANSILHDIAVPIPTIDPVEVRGDPRRQLNDTCIIDTKRTGRIIAAVIGYKRSITRGNPMVDLYTLRALHPPGFWLIGEAGFSELGETTQLS